MVQSQRARSDGRLARGGAARALPYISVLGLAWMLGCGPSAAPAPDARPSAGAAEAATAPQADPQGVVLFLGTSLTAGYGLPVDEAYPAHVQQRIDEAGLPYRVVNAGVSGDTSAGGLARLDWLLRQPVAVLVLELGANDMLRGQEPDAMRRNLQAIVDRTRERHPGAKLVVAGMRAAPNLGAVYVEPYESSFRELADRNDGALIPFLLDGVAGDPELNQADGIHPTAEGQRILADTVWQTLGPILDASG